jgi:hypothetical protein
MRFLLVIVLLVGVLSSQGMGQQIVVLQVDTDATLVAKAPLSIKAGSLIREVHQLGDGGIEVEVSFGKRGVLPAGTKVTRWVAQQRSSGLPGGGFGAEVDWVVSQPTPAPFPTDSGHVSPWKVVRDSLFDWLSKDPDALKNFEQFLKKQGPSFPPSK